MNREKEWHDELYVKKLGARSEIMPLYEVARQARERLHCLLLEWAGPGLKVLDYGCGTGELAFSVVEKGAQVMGVDISSEAIRQARAEARRRDIERRVTFLEMDAHNLQFPDSTFDVVYGVSILHHLSLREAYREVSRVLRPSGRAIFLEPLGYNPIINYFRSLTPHLRSPDEHPLLEGDIELAAHFFRTVRCEYYALFSLLGIAALKTRLKEPVLSLLESLDRVVLRSSLMGKYAWQVVLLLEAPY